MYEVRQYETESGDCPFSNWFGTLPAGAADRVDTVLARMRQGNLGDHKRVGEGVFERRIDYGPGYRVYFGKHGDRVVILIAGGTKKRQSRDIRAAKQAWRDYKQRKRRAEAEERSTERWH